jgi:hypothetical protein
MYISENEPGSYHKNHKRKMRLMLKKRFKDDDLGRNEEEPDEEAKGPDDTDMKILDSDYSSSTFHLASRSSINGMGRQGQMKNGTGYGSRLSMNTSGMQTYTTGFYESHQGGMGDDQSTLSKHYFNMQRKSLAVPSKHSPILIDPNQLGAVRVHPKY